MNTWEQTPSDLSSVHHVFWNLTIVPWLQLSKPCLLTWKVRLQLHLLYFYLKLGCMRRGWGVRGVQSTPPPHFFFACQKGGGVLYEDTPNTRWKAEIFTGELLHLLMWRTSPGPGKESFTGETAGLKGTRRTSPGKRRQRSIISEYAPFPSACYKFALTHTDIRTCTLTYTHTLTHKHTHTHTPDTHKHTQYTCARTYTYVYPHTHVHTRTHTYASTNRYARVRPYVHARRAHTYNHNYHTRTHIHPCACIHTHTHTCMYYSTCTRAHTHTRTLTNTRVHSTQTHACTDTNTLTAHILTCTHTQMHWRAHTHTHKHFPGHYVHASLILESSDLCVIARASAEPRALNLTLYFRHIESGIQVFVTMATSPGNWGQSERCSYTFPGLPARNIRRLSPGKLVWKGYCRYFSPTH